MKKLELTLTLIFVTVVLVGCVGNSIRKDYQRTMVTAARYQNQQNFRLAERYHRQALDEMRVAPGVTDDEFAVQLSNLASAINQNGRPKEAEPLLREALELLNRQSSPDPGDMAVVLSNLAQTCELQDDLDNAEVLYLKSLEFEKDIPNWPPQFTGFSMAKLANLYARRGELEKADQYYEIAKKLYASGLGRNSRVWKRRVQEYKAFRTAAIERMENAR